MLVDYTSPHTFNLLVQVFRTPGQAALSIRNDKSQYAKAKKRAIAYCTKSTRPGCAQALAQFRAITFRWKLEGSVVYSGGTADKREAVNFKKNVALASGRSS